MEACEAFLRAFDARHLGGCTPQTLIGVACLGFDGMRLRQGSLGLRKLALVATQACQGFTPSAKICRHFLLLFLFVISIE